MSPQETREVMVKMLEFKTLMRRKMDSLPLDDLKLLESWGKMDDAMTNFGFELIKRLPIGSIG